MNGYCKIELCGKPVENRDSGLCATHNRLDRKINNIKLPDDPKPMKKVSDVQSKLLSMYAPLKKKFLHGRWCGMHGRPCIPTDIHHTAGREGMADDGVTPRLLDVTHWLAVCRQGHDWITEHSKEAIEQGYSESRTAKQETK